MAIPAARKQLGKTFWLKIIPSLEFHTKIDYKTSVNTYIIKAF